MKNHVWRPLYIVVAFVALILLVRGIVVPPDFGAHERGYRFGWHRLGNEAEWKEFKVKYQARDYCKDCHPDNWDMNQQSPHAIINCQNCHGPAIDHPEEPAKLAIDRTRELCLRCHAKLPYVGTARYELKGIDNEEHNPDMECVMCHNPHSPGF